MCSIRRVPTQTATPKPLCRTPPAQKLPSDDTNAKLPPPNPDTPEHPMPAEELLRLRASIDNIDAALIHMLAERFKRTQEVGRLKARLGLPAEDKTREAEQVKRLRALAEGAKLDPEFAEKFLAFVVKEVIRHHEAIAKA